MCLRSWIDEGMIKVPSNWAKAAVDIEKVLGDSATRSLTMGLSNWWIYKFERFVLEAKIMW
jgi:hypothetical protein